MGVTRRFRAWSGELPDKYGAVPRGRVRLFGNMAGIARAPLSGHFAGSQFRRGQEPGGPGRVLTLPNGCRVPTSWTRFHPDRASKATLMIGRRIQQCRMGE